MEKVSMKYRVATCKNPKTGGAMLRPIITDRPSMSLRSLVEYAKNASYVRGQTKDLEGLLGGFIQAMQDRAKAGYSINVNDWFIISGRLKGQVDATGALTARNEYHVTITASKDLKVGIDNFSWQNVGDDGKAIRIDSISSPGGEKNEVIKTKAIVANGRNVSYNADWGDTAKVSWTDEDGEAHELALTPSEQSAVYLRFDWPTGLAEVEPGTMLEFSFRLHGKEGGTEKLNDIEAKLVAAS